MAATVDFDHVTLSYGPVSALRDLSTTFEPGLNVVLGPNGAGKTTLFRIGAGILLPDGGTVSIDGTDPFADQSVKSRIGYLPYGTPLNPQLTVEENLDYWGRIIGLDRGERTERIARTSETVGVTELRDRQATDLSRGQRQRAIIARLLLGDPTVLALLKSSKSYRSGRQSDWMEALQKLQLLQSVEQAYNLARRAVARYSSKSSKRRYTLHQHIVLLCLKVRKDTTYRMLLDELIEIPRIQKAINLAELPSPSTLCEAFNRLDMAVWRVLLNLSITLLPTNDVVGIDAFDFDRCHAPKHDTKRTKLTIQQLNVTLLVDTRANAIPDLHVTTTRKHDSQIAPSLLKRHAGNVAILLGDTDTTTRRFAHYPVTLAFVLSSSTENFRRSTRRGMLGWTPTSMANGVRTRQ